MLWQNPNHGKPLGLKESSNQGVELGWLHGIEIEMEWDRNSKQKGEESFCSLA